MYINTYIQYLEKWYWWTYLKGRNGDADIENGLVEILREGKGGANWDSSIDIYTLSCIKCIAGRMLIYKSGISAWPFVTT